MFTGIIKCIGTIKNIANNTISIQAADIINDLNTGDSVSVNGVCLTVTGKTGNAFKSDLLNETIKRTNLKYARAGTRVNLELALKANDRLGGHIVSGHVDGIGKILRRHIKGKDVILDIEFPVRSLLPMGEKIDYRKYLVPKGSVAVDGVSLTIVSLTKKGFIVHIIPHTASVTTLGGRRIADKLNIEADMILKNVLGREAMKKCRLM